jgi:hypothetical protein
MDTVEFQANHEEASVHWREVASCNGSDSRYAIEVVTRCTARLCYTSAQK